MSEIAYQMAKETAEKARDAVFTQQCKVASYRALVGKQAAEIRRLKAAVRDALDQLPNGTPARSILERTLEARTDG